MDAKSTYGAQVTFAALPSPSQHTRSTSEKKSQLVFQYALSIALEQHQPHMLRWNAYIHPPTIISTKYVS